MKYLRENPLIDKSKPHGVIRFVPKGGGKHSFWVATNQLTGDRLAAFDNCAPTINEPIKDLMGIFKDITDQSAYVIGYEGSKHFDFVPKSPIRLES